MSFTLDIIDDARDFERISDIWDSLVLSSQNHTAFQAWAYLFNHWYYRNSGDGFRRKLRIVTLVDGSELVAIAPLWLTTVRRAVGVLGFIGDHGCDYLDFVVSPSVDRVSALKHMIAFILEIKDWHVLVLSEVRAKSSSDVCAALDYLSIRYSCRPCSACYSIPLPPTYDQYLSSLGKSTRRRLLYDRKRLEALHNASFNVCAEFTPDFRSTLAEIHAIHQERWSAASQPGAFHDSQAQRMDCAINEALGQKGMLRYFVLSVGKKPIAALSGALVEDHLYTHIMSVSRDEELRKWSPGMVMLSHVVEWAIDHGLRTLDLTRGSEAYKTSLGGESSTNYRIIVPRNWLVRPFVKVAEVAGIPL